MLWAMQLNVQSIKRVAQGRGVLRDRCAWLYAPATAYVRSRSLFQTHRPLAAMVPWIYRSLLLLVCASAFEAWCESGLNLLARKWVMAVRLTEMPSGGSVDARDSA